MAYGILKVDTITFTDGGVDKSVPVSGLVLNPTFTGNVTVTGTISGNIIQGGTTVSGLTVTGTTANFASGVFTTQVSGLLITGPTVSATTGTFTSLTGTTTNGTTASFTTGNFTSLTGTTTTGTTANFASGVFTTQVSGLLITGPTVSATTGTFTSLTGTTTTGTTANFASGVFTTQISGVTITGTTVSTTTGNFTSLTGTTATITSGIIASGTAALPSLAILSDPNTGIYSPGADQLAVATNGTSRLSIDANGKVGVGTASPAQLLHVSGSGTQAIRLENTLGTGNVNLELKLTNGTFTTGLNSSSIFYDDTAGREYVWYQNSAERMRLDTSGRLGIGTSSPGSAIDVQTSAQAIASFSSTNANGGYVTVGRAGALSLYGNYKAASGGGTVINADSLFFRSANGIGFGPSGGDVGAFLDTSGRLGIGVTSPSYPLDVKLTNDTYILAREASNNITTGFRIAGPNNEAQAIFSSNSATGEVRLGGINTNYFQTFYSNNSEKARIDTSGRLLVGTSTALTGSVSQYAKLAVVGNTSNGANGAYFAIGRGTAGTSFVSGTDIGQIFWTDNAGAEFASIAGAADGTCGAGDFPGRLVFSTTADGASSPTERMRITNGGNLLIGTTTNTARLTTGIAGGSEGTIEVSFLNGGCEFFINAQGGANAAACVQRIGANSTNARSINAGGTINALGTDYAEYMSKAGNFIIAKGDICGITVDGLITNVFANAISFVVKSTNPSYVGGDTWGTGFDEDPEGLEVARQTVDRIAFAGQVPVNVTGATPGQYIVPVEFVDGGIKGVAKDEADLTLSEYMRAVGKVIAIEDDGRARIIVKVA